METVPRIRVLIALLTPLLAVLAPSSAHAHDRGTYLTDDSAENYLPGINRPWIIDDQPFNVCTDWNPLPPEVAVAFADWEAVLPDTQFNMTCSSGSVFEIKRQSVRGSTICPGKVACYQTIPPEEVYTEDIQRAAFYITHPVVWINDDPTLGGYSFSQDGLGLRSVVAHEMGHVFGLHDLYLHEALPGQECNTGVTTIMNSAAFQGNTVTNGCTGIYQPATQDVTNVIYLYNNHSLPSIPFIDAKGADIVATVIDANRAESNIAMLVEWWNGISYSFYDSRALRHDVGRWGQLITFVYRLPANAPEGLYAVCAYAYSGLYTGPDACSSPVYVIPNEPLRDTDGDGYTDRDEAGWPMCYGTQNDDAALGDPDLDVNDGCPAYGGLKEIGFQCYSPNAVDDDSGDDSMVNDGCPQDGAFSEASFRIGTDHRSRCHPGAESGPSPGWPSDFSSALVPNSVDKITIHDLTSFLAPSRRLDTNPGHPSFDARWDLVPGRGLFANFISVNDLTALIAGPSGFPPMSGGQKAFNGFTCTGS